MNVRDQGLTKVDIPTLMMYPAELFGASPSLTIVPTFDSSLALYSSNRLVKSQASETQKELSKSKEECQKLRLRLKDLESKLSRVGSAFSGGHSRETTDRH